MAIRGEIHGGRRENSGRKRKHEHSNSEQRMWNSRQFLFTARAELRNNWDEIQTENSENAHREGAVMEGKKFTYYIFKVLYTYQIIYNTMSPLSNTWMHSTPCSPSSYS